MHDNRHKKQDVVISETDESGQKQKRKTVITDVVLLQTPLGSFEYLISPIDNQGQSLISLEEIIKCKLKYYYSDYNFPLPIVAITDGASSIRKRLHSLDPRGITLILDWYHLCKKLREFLSMITRNSAEKKTQIKARNQKKLDELITYITKHESEIINKQLRRQAGKTIGSGRRSKGVDTLYGHRQKHKGMSWTRLGSKALAILKVTECNGQWRQIWFPQIAA